MHRLLLLLFYIIFLITACQEQASPPVKVKSYKKISGTTMGVVSYQISYKDPKGQISQVTIDSLLNALNMGNSHYEKTSTISRFNDSTNGITIENNGYDQHFIKNILLAKEIAAASNNYFDPTVAPLMEYYGFRKKTLKGVEVIDTSHIEELMQSIGFDKINIEQTENEFKISKNNAKTRLDFSAVAKGYALDEVGHFLEQKGIHNYWIDIGGESRTRGKNTRGVWWRIGIQDPRGPRNTPIAVANMENRAMATSGNYESFRIIDGQKIGHTMNPKTGFPELNNLLSATAFAADCSVADSYATAFMTMGMEKAFNLAQKLPTIEAYLVYFDENGTVKTKYTDGLEGVIDNLLK